MNGIIRDILLTSTLLKNEYTKICEQDSIIDFSVRNCIINMYFYMMTSADNAIKKEEHFKQFEESYNNLTKEQQEIVKQEYINIIETQKKNREKVKRKGMINYE